MIDEEKRTLITLFRLERLRLDWCVYWAYQYPPARAYTLLAECRNEIGDWDYFRSEVCNLLSGEMVAVLEELER